MSAPRGRRAGAQRPGRSSTPRPIEDRIGDRPRLLFVGINPSLTSGLLGHHFASQGNPFWRLLHASGLLAEPLTAEEDHRLPEFRMGLTNICRRPTRAAADLLPEEIEAGRAALRRKIARVRPEVVVFVGLSLYQKYYALPKSGGAGAKPEREAGARVFVVPNPSGLNASFPGFQSKLEWFVKLREFVEGLERGEG